MGMKIPREDARKLLDGVTQSAMDAWEEKKELRMYAVTGMLTKVAFDISARMRGVVERLSEEEAFEDTRRVALQMELVWSDTKKPKLTFVFLDPTSASNDAESRR